MPKEAKVFGALTLILLLVIAGFRIATNIQSTDEPTAVLKQSPAPPAARVDHLTAFRPMTPPVLASADNATEKKDNSMPTRGELEAMKVTNYTLFARTMMKWMKPPGVRVGET